MTKKSGIFDVATAPKILPKTPKRGSKSQENVNNSVHTASWRPKSYQNLQKCSNINLVNVGNPSRRTAKVTNLFRMGVVCWLLIFMIVIIIDKWGQAKSFLPSFFLRLFLATVQIRRLLPYILTNESKCPP
jgi:hypothetical protein